MLIKWLLVNFLAVEEYAAPKIVITNDFEINNLKSTHVIKSLTSSQVYTSNLLTGWKFRGSNPGWGEIFPPFKTGPEGHPVSYAMGTVSFPGVKLPGRGVDQPPHLVPR